MTNMKHSPAAYIDVRENMNTGFLPKLSSSEIRFKEEDAVTNTEHSPAAYINVREDASTGFLPKLPLKTDLPFGIYIHWPYCLSKCPYCDFFSKVKKDVPQDEIIEDYLKELDFYYQYTGDQCVTSIFFGGGTPSLIAPQNIEKIINHIARRWKLSQQVEISLEANPNSGRPKLFQDLKNAGVNRLSLGIQALNDADLKFLGRTHNLQQAYQAMEDVLKLFDNHSIDLIYARPAQSLKQWQEEIKQAASFGFKHLSMYQLTIEEGTVFHKKGVKPLEENAAAEMYDFTNAFLRTRNYNQYEISNYACSGFESVHNQIYWTGNDYLGIGPAAHGRIKSQGKIFASTHRCIMEELTPEERAEELVLMGLRLNRGISRQGFKHNCGMDFDAFVNRENLRILLQKKLLEDNGGNIRATDSGRLVLNKIIEDLCS